MKVLVIGGAGYIGSHVTGALLDDGYDADVLDNFSTGLRENMLKGSNLIEADILDYPKLEKVIAEYDAVIHLAASKSVGESMINPEKYSVNNITGSINILNAMSAGGVKNIIFSSSAAIFGEPLYLPIDEQHPKNPTSYYGFTKLKIEEFLAWYHTLKGINYASLRYFNACGYDRTGKIRGLEKNPANLLPIIMEVAIGKRTQLDIFGNDYPTVDGTCVRDYIHVSDLARAHVAALDYIIRKDRSECFNLGTEIGLSVMDLYQAAVSITGTNIPVHITKRRSGDPATLVASSKLAEELLGWAPTESSIDTLVKSTYRAYCKS